MSEGLNRELRFGILGVSVVSIGMLIYAIYGRPPYAFYSMLRWAVAFTASVGSWALFRISKLLLPLSLCLVLVGGMHLFARMRKSDWILYNEGAGLLFLVLVVIIGVDLMRRK